MNGRRRTMDTSKLTAIDMPPQREVPCRKPFGSCGQEHDRAADKSLRSSKR